MILRVATGSATFHRPTRRDGMSLLEVLIAMAVFLICLTGIGQLVDAGSDKALEAKYQNTATRLALSKLAEVEAGVIPVSEGGSGDFTEDGDDQWQWSIESTEVLTNAYDVVVTVSRPYRGVTFSLKMSQIVYDPMVTGNASEAMPTPLVPPPETPPATTGGGTTTPSGSGQ